MKKYLYLLLLFLASCIQNETPIDFNLKMAERGEYCVKKESNPFDEHLEVFQILEIKGGYYLLHNLTKNDSAGVKESVLKGDFKRYKGTIPPVIETYNETNTPENQTDTTYSN